MRVTRFDVRADDQFVVGSDRPFIHAKPTRVFRVDVAMLMSAEEVDRFTELVRRDWGVSVPGAPSMGDPTPALRTEEGPRIGVAEARRLLGR